MLVRLRVGFLRLTTWGLDRSHDRFMISFPVTVTVLKIASDLGFGWDLMGPDDFGSLLLDRCSHF